MFFRPRSCELEPVVALLERRVKALEELGGVHMVERNHLLSLLASSESRLRALLTKAEGLKHTNGNTTQLDNALLRRKGL